MESGVHLPGRRRYISPVGIVLLAFIASTGVAFAGLPAKSSFLSPVSRTSKSAALRGSGRQTSSPEVPWNIGDVFVGVADLDPSISYRVFDPNTLTFKDTINDQQGSGEHTGCAFDANYNLYTTSFDHDSVVEFDAAAHTVINTIDTTVDIAHVQPESIVFDNGGNFYVGKAGDSGSSDGVILKFDQAGNRQGTYHVLKDVRGADWVDLAADQHTIYYTSEGHNIREYDVTSGAQTIFATLSPLLWAHRILPQGDANHFLLVATDNDIELLNSSGQVVQTYTAPGDSNWFALNLDPNGTSFWSATQSSSHHFYRWNIATGAIEIGPIDGMAAIGGLCVKGEITAAQPTPTATSTDTPQPGQSTNTPVATPTTGQPTSTSTATTPPAPTQTCTPPHMTVGMSDPGTPTLIHSTTGKSSLAAAPHAGKSAAAPVAGPTSPDAALNFQLDDGSKETQIGFGSQAQNTEYAALWLNRFTPPAGTYPVRLNGIQVYWPTQQTGTILGKQAKLVVYQDSDGDGNPSNAILLYQALVTVNSTENFESYPVNVTLPGPSGDVYIGFEDYWAEAGYTPELYPAAEDTTPPSRMRSWLAAMSDGSPPSLNNLGANTILGTSDSFGFAGNWMIRASGAYGQGGCGPNPTNTPAVTPSCTIQFSDVPPGSTFYTYIECLACKGIISGYADGTFRPGNNVTRGQLAKIVANSASFQEDPGAQLYQDVPLGSTFYPYINRLTNHRVMSGYSCGAIVQEPCVAPDNLPYFRPNANATRGQISKIVVNTAITVFGWVLGNPADNTFEDVPSGSTFYQYIETAYEHNVLGGYPCGSLPAGECVPPENKPYFLPANNATRGQTSKIVSNTFFPDCQSLEGRR